VTIVVNVTCCIALLRAVLNRAGEVAVGWAQVEPGADWNDYNACNNRTWWWNSYSGQLFVGDVIVPETGNVDDMEIISQWAPGRTHPEARAPTRPPRPRGVCARPAPPGHDPVGPDTHGRAGRWGWRGAAGTC
jgi:hypothetical protein